MIFHDVGLPGAKRVELRPFRDARGAFSLAADEAMIREVHVYGAVAALGHASTGAQHTGLGRKLVARPIVHPALRSSLAMAVSAQRPARQVNRTPPGRSRGRSRS